MVCFVGIANFSCKICASPDRCQRLPHTMPISPESILPSSKRRRSIVTTCTNKGNPPVKQTGEIALGGAAGN